MPYVTSIERMGIQQGIEQGIQQGIEQGIEQGILKNSRENVIEILVVRFTSIPDALEQVVGDIEDLAVLKMLHKKAATVSSLEEFEKLLDC